MMRRIFFLLPNKQHIRDIVVDLKQQGVSQTHMHIVSGHRRDRIYNIEKRLWFGNILMFFIALIATFVLIVFGLYLYTILTLVIMTLCLTLGALFTTKIPNTHISEFESALKHGEVLLVVNTQKQQVRNIEHNIRRRHPEVITGGVGWTI